MSIELQPYLVQLARSSEAIRALVQGVSPDQSRWRPAPEKWSMVEVVAHLGDEEELDFRARLDHVLSDRPGPWPPTDPEAWCRDRHYIERDLPAELERFLSRRTQTLEWLQSLRLLDADLAYHHPRVGPVRAGELFASWLAHDLLHLRQLTRLHFDWIERVFAPYGTAYAGKW